MGFVDYYVERRIRKNTFFKQINTLIDWKEIDKEYKRGHSVDGRPAYICVICILKNVIHNFQKPFYFHRAGAFH
jgi:hypothetical protein